MGLSGCYSLIKYLMVLINFLFWLIGFAVVILAIWMLTDPTFYLSMTQEEINYNISLYIFLVVGALMLIVAFLGCCGAFKESKCLLISFVSFLLVILVAEVAAGVWAYTNAPELEQKIRNSVKTTVQEEYGNVHTRTVTFDVIQKNLKCCGANGPRDWNGSNFNKKDKSEVLVQVSNIIPIPYDIPKSCCRDGIEGADCDQATSNVIIGASIHQGIHTQGCIDKLVDVIRDHMNIVAGVAIGIIAIEVLGILCSLILCFAINRTGYKA